MPTGSESLQGPRLEFVVRPIPGTVMRTKFTPPPSKDDKRDNKSQKGQTANTPIRAKEPAGFMLYTPSGASYRLTQKQLIQKGFDRPPNILNRESAKDTKTPAGRFLLAIYQADKEKAYKEMEEEVIKHCAGKIGGNIEGLVSDLDQTGTMKEAA